MATLTKSHKKVPPDTPDILIENYGTVCIIQPLTTAGWEWTKEHISYESWQMIGGGIASEPRMTQDIIDGATEAGLTVKV